MIYNYMLFILLFVIFIISISLVIYHFVYSSFDRKNGIYYMNKEETLAFLTKDEDNFVKNLSEIDLYARNVSSINKYKENFEKIAASFTETEIQILNKTTIIADKLLNTIKFIDINYINYINLNDIANIKWIFAKTIINNSENDKEIKYENGFPHTRKNIIFLSNTFFNYDEEDIVKILIHEKIHIYQRYNEELFNKVIEKMGYIELKNEILVNDFKLTNQLKYKRSNPDINNKIYKKISTNKILICTYNSDTPKSISDVTGGYHNEHPYEEIAYELSEYIYDKTKIETYKNI